jgi:hypothetical protein
MVVCIDWCRGGGIALISEKKSLEYEHFLIKFQQVSEYSYNQELLFIDAILTTSESRKWMQHRTHKIIVVVKETAKLDTHAQVQAAQTGPGFFPLSLLAPGSQHANQWKK